MCSRATGAATWLVLLAAGAARADFLLWDNYPDGVFLPDWSVSSERNTIRAEPTWVVDDVLLAGPPTVPLTRIEWLGTRDPAYAYDRVDLIVLASMFDSQTQRTVPDPSTAVTRMDLTSFTATRLSPDPNPAPESEVYQGELLLDAALLPPAAHFYVGVRLVGAGANNDGTNGTVVAGMDASPRGLTEGFFLGPSFGVDQWTPVSDLFGRDDNFEFAFRVFGVPEPATAVLLAAGALLGSRRLRTRIESRKLAD